jgi:8-oxo-dGTP pyrophosphatase MutT (NUDIX family)
MEEKDKSLTETALREAEEETGMDRDKVKIIGTLTPLYIPVSNINVTPVVGWTGNRPRFKPHENEVLFIIEAGLSSFIDHSIVKVGPFDIRGEKINIRYFDYKGNVIWGATAMMLHELLTIARQANLSPLV